MAFLILFDFVLRKAIPPVDMAYCPVDFCSSNFILGKAVPSIHMAYCSIDFITHKDSYLQKKAACWMRPLRSFG